MPSHVHSNDASSNCEGSIGRAVRRLPLGLRYSGPLPVRAVRPHSESRLAGIAVALWLWDRGEGSCRGLGAVLSARSADAWSAASAPA
jgi:hypothetical protein